MAQQQDKQNPAEPSYFERWQAIKAKGPVAAAQFYNQFRLRIEASRPSMGIVGDALQSLERDGVKDPGADFLDKAALRDKYHDRFKKLLAERKDEIMARIGKAAPGLAEDVPRNLAVAFRQSELLRAAEREVAEQIAGEIKDETARLTREHFAQLSADQGAWEKQRAEENARQLAAAKAEAERNRILNMIGLG